ncbi:hypothetical protein C8Q79DRAFT_918269 [Trametes meyenii]|nr:hypothetical protein C8Q79DRAFT_918269 [Trametes meyenii]
MFGILTAASAVSQEAHTTDQPSGTSRGWENASEFYWTLFLDCIATLWRHECHRRANKMYPPCSLMPWSPESKAASNTTLAGPALMADAPILDESDLAGHDDPALEFMQSVFGSLPDIPWFHAPHDGGYPTSTTLHGYVGIRRTVDAQTLADDAALWVGAMTFGLLEAITFARIPQAVLVEMQGNRMVLSGRRISRLLVHWHKRIHHHFPHPEGMTHLQHGRRVATLLRHALDALEEQSSEDSTANLFRRAGFAREISRIVVDAIAPTVTLLCILASATWTTLPQMASLMARVQGQTRPFQRAAREACMNMMLRVGWCPNTISHHFLNTLTHLSILLSLVRLPLYIRTSPDEHTDCSKTSCILYKVDTYDTYIPRHVCADCHCEYIRPPLDEVKRLLDAGVAPAMVYNGEKLRVQAASKNSYVMISHVWADGMGSVTEKGLPTCLIRRIASLAEILLPESGAFWIDALCIPAAHGPRKQAVKLMVYSYQNAAKVLVMDVGIRTSCSERAPWETNLLHIATAGWMRRVWTLQEGLLANELWFEFAEGPVHVEERIIRELRSALPSKPSLAAPLSQGQPSQAPWWTFVREITPMLYLRICRRGAAPGHYQFPLDEVIKLLQLRTMTSPDDEILAISSLLPSRINVDELLSIAGAEVAQQRMKAFLLQLGQVSRALLRQTSPRLTLPGFTWAPRTLSATALENISGQVGSGLCTENGFIAEFQVASFRTPITIPLSLNEDPENGLKVLISWDCPQASESRLTYYRLHVSESSPDGMRPALIHSLLFFEASFSGTKIDCVAVHDDLDEFSGNDSSVATPRFRYVGYGSLYRLALPPSTSVARDMPILEQSETRRVLLR